MLHSDGLGSLLLESRTTAPEFNTGFVRREELIRKLRDSGSRMVTVVAPAGYGKTSLLAEWANLEQRSTAWLSLRDGDTDPVELMRLVARSCAGLDGVDASAFEQVAASGGEALARMAPALAIALSKSDRAFVLFIDDVHFLSVLECADALGIALAGVPKGSQVVLAGRRNPRSYARGRLTADAAHIDADDLRIDAHGAARIAEDAGAKVDSATLTAWVDRCDGWAAGLHMCALLAKENPLATLRDEALLSDYLYHECMQELPESTRRFLLEISPLQIQIPELCDAVLGRDDSAQVLRDLESRQLFVTADRERAAYHLHPLFHEYLADELKMVSPSTVSLLHLKAAQWFQEQGLLPEALDHAIAAQQYDLATALLTAVALGAYESGQGARLGRWLEEIGDTRVLANPTAVVIIAWFAVLAASDEIAEKWHALLNRLPDDAPAEGVDIASSKAMIGAIMMRKGMAQALVDAEYACSVEGVDSPWRDPALQILGSTLLHAGHSQRGAEVLTEARHIADARGNPATVVICETELALLAIEAGDWKRAHQRVANALHAIQRGHIEGYVMSPYAHAAAACVQFNAGHRVDGLRHLTWAMSERHRCGRAVPLLGIPTRLLLARANLMLDDDDAARLLLAEVEEIAPPDPGAALQARIHAIRQTTDHLRISPGRRNQSIALTAAEQRLLPYLQTHLTRADIAQRLFVSHNTVGTQMTTIFRKLGVANRSEAVKRALELELLGSAPELSSLP